MKKEAIILLWLLILLGNANAARVGVVVTFPNGETFTKCLQVSESDNGYTVLNSAGLSIAWSYYDLWGHGLCGINGFGCSSDNCWCSSEYWGFFTKGVNDRSWDYSPVGFDGGSGCSEHYCAGDGELIGLAYGPYGTKPGKYSFEDVCSSQERRKRIFIVSTEPKEPKLNDVIKINVTDNETYKGIRSAEIELFSGEPGESRTLFFGKTNNDGILEFPINETGKFTIRVNVPKYHPSQEYIELYVIKPTTTTTSTTITSTTTTTTTTETTTSTTITVPVVLMTTSEETTTTSTTAATSTTSLTTTITVQQFSLIGNAIKFPDKFSTEGNVILDVLLLLLLSWFFVFKKTKLK